MKSLMNRIDRKFQELNKTGKKAFIVYLTAGDPSLQVTEQLVLALAREGVDIIELGVPFSDPLADGPTIQAASQRALKNKVTLQKILALTGRLRRQIDIPLALMTYYNPVFHFGEAAFVRQAKKKGVDGLIIPDLPPEEAGTLILAARRHDMATVFFLSPTTTRSRMKTIALASTGFIYYVSLTGVTGARQQLPRNLAADLKKVKQVTQKPVCVGFGISTKAQARSMMKASDGVIVGSAIIKVIERNIGKKKLVNAVIRFVRQLM